MASCAATAYAFSSAAVAMDAQCRASSIPPRKAGNGSPAGRSTSEAHEAALTGDSDSRAAIASAARSSSDMRTVATLAKPSQGAIYFEIFERGLPFTCGL